MTQDEHEKWNSHNYPGTRQLCYLCDEPTGRCEDDSLYMNEDDDLDHTVCFQCYDAAKKDGAE